MHDQSFLGATLIFLIAAVLVAPVFQRLRSSLVLGYLVAGIIIGPSALDLVSGDGTVKGIAELGVVFLLFTVGLELSVERLRLIRNQIFGMGTAQVAVTSLVLAGAALAAGFEWQTAIIVGGGLALSSTAVVLQLLSERGELSSRRGRLVFAILLLQDLAVVPLLALVPAFAGTEDTATSLLWTLGKAILALAIVAVIGRTILRPALRAVAIGKSPELFAAVTLAVLLGMSWITSELGLSMALGGFLAGLLLAETEFRHQVEADIQPFRGLLLGLFFMTVGIGLDLGIVAANVLSVLALVIGLIFVKATIIFILCRLSHVPAPVAANTSLVLGQAGEFGFALFALAAGYGLLPVGEASLLAAVIAVSMAATPALALLGARLNALLEARQASHQGDIAAENADLKDHVIVAGFGRVGQSVVKALSAANVPYVAVEFEPTRVAEARARGLSVYYGDASRVEVLEALGAERARAAVIILDNAIAAERSVVLLHEKFPRLSIYVRARDNAQKRRLADAGASGIVHETYELSLQLGEAVLRNHGTPDERVREIVRDLRADDYAALADVIMPTPAPPHDTKEKMSGTR